MNPYEYMINFFLGKLEGGLFEVVIPVISLGLICMAAFSIWDRYKRRLMKILRYLGIR